MAPKTARRVLVCSDVPYTRVLLKQTIVKQGYEVVTANSGADGLRNLSGGKFDLFVLDLNSAPNAGEHLLLQVRVTGSTVPVILLSAMLDRDMIRRLTNVRPVGFLTKPFSVEALKELLPMAIMEDANLLRRSTELSRFRAAPDGAPSSAKATAAAAQEMLEEAQIDEDRLKRMFGSMPLLPHVVARILQMSGDEEASARELAEVISGDPRLCGQLLRIVNSAYFGFARRIATIPEATVILGSQAIRNLTLGAAVANFFGGRSKLVDRTMLWRHALAVAIASRKVAERSGLSGAEESFTAGLLHDFGRLAMERQLTELYAKPLTISREQAVPLLDAEDKALGLNHAWLSGWLAQKWNLPAVLTEALAWHHRPESAAEGVRTVAATVNVGDVICHMAGLGGIEGVPATLEASAYAIGMLNVDLEQTDDLIAEIRDETAKMEQQLSVALQQAAG